MTLQRRKELLAELRTTSSHKRVRQIIEAILADLPSDRWIEENVADREWWGRPKGSTSRPSQKEASKLLD